ncbi:MAG TPA: winged helix-turn-helix domain-containing protein [Burkholderiales bacterium]|nr:winged helix-turn-helix domain-containing protein [Burkholderiales bacterium]
MDGQSRQAVYEFGEFRVDVAQRLLLLKAGSRALPLSSRAFDTLVFFLEHPGELLDKSTLMAAIWPKLVVEENNLNQQISALRRALGQRPEEHRFIVTVPGRGYRFIAPVSLVAGSATAEDAASAPRSVRRPRLPALAVMAALAAAALLTGVYGLWHARYGASGADVHVEAPSRSELPANVAPTRAVVFSPPPHSIAVLPFVNMSGDKEQDYFSDGLSEELLNDLSRINGLQVAARTSSFSFKGKDTDIGTIARKLNVGAVLEGSVRRSSHTVRITAQLNNAVTGFHIWSQTYDRDLGDVLKLQAEIASAVASALKVTLLGDATTTMEVGGTHNPAAYDAYLRSASAFWQIVSASDNESVRAGYQEAVRLDPSFALAYAEWSIALGAYASQFAHGPAMSDFHRRSLAPALKAVELAPDLAEGHLALAIVRADSLDFAGATDEYQRAVTLAPGNARILRDYGVFAAELGRADAGIAAARRAVALDPLSVESHGHLSGALLSARRYDEALAAYQDGLALRPRDPTWPTTGQLIYYALGDFEKMRAVCEGVGEAVKNFQDCLALAYHKLGRQADAETALGRFKALQGNAGAYGYATIYAQWGNTREALSWLETALQVRDPQLTKLKTELLLDPLRQEPRFRAIERELRFPSD